MNPYDYLCGLYSVWFHKIQSVNNNNIQLTIFANDNPNKMFVASAKPWNFVYNAACASERFHDVLDINNGNSVLQWSHRNANQNAMNNLDGDAIPNEGVILTSMLCMIFNSYCEQKSLIWTWFEITEIHLYTNFTLARVSNAKSLFSSEFVVELLKMISILIEIYVMP